MRQDRGEERELRRERDDKRDSKEQRRIIDVSRLVESHAGSIDDPTGIEVLSVPIPDRRSDDREVACLPGLSVKTLLVKRELVFSFCHIGKVGRDRVTGRTFL